MRQFHHRNPLHCDTSIHCSSHIVATFSCVIVDGAGGMLEVKQHSAKYGIVPDHYSLTGCGWAGLEAGSDWTQPWGWCCCIAGVETERQVSRCFEICPLRCNDRVRCPSQQCSQQYIHCFMDQLNCYHWEHQVFEINTCCCNYATEQCARAILEQSCICTFPQ